jgi:hypothetical protein
MWHWARECERSSPVSWELQTLTIRIQHGFTSVGARTIPLPAASVLQLRDSGVSDLREVRRFNKGIDEALTSPWTDSPSPTISRDTSTLGR